MFCKGSIDVHDIVYIWFYLFIRCFFLFPNRKIVPLISSIETALPIQYIMEVEIKYIDVPSLK